MSRKIILGFVLLILILSLPITIFLVKQQTNNRSNAAAPDQLEAEGGVLSAGTQTKTDANASGGQYVAFTNSIAAQSAGRRTTTVAMPNVPNGTYVENVLANQVYTPDVLWQPASGTIYTMPIGATQGQQDSFIDSIPDGTVDNPTILVFPTGNTWTRGSGSLNWNAIKLFYPRQYIILWGYGAKINNTAMSGYDYDSTFVIGARGDGSRTNNVHHIKVLGFEIAGPNTCAGGPGAYGCNGAKEWSFGVFLGQAVDHIEIADVHSHHTISDSIHINSSYTQGINGTPTYLSIHHNLLELTGRVGAVLNAGDHLYFKHNIVRDTAWASVGAEDSRSTANYFNEVHISDNLFQGDYSDTNNLPAYTPIQSYFSYSNHYAPNSFGTWTNFYWERNRYIGSKTTVGAQPDHGPSRYLWFGDYFEAEDKALPKSNIYIRDNDYSGVPADRKYHYVLHISKCDNLVITGNKWGGVPIGTVNWCTNVTNSGNQ